MTADGKKVEIKGLEGMRGVRRVVQDGEKKDLLVSHDYHLLKAY